MIATTAVETEKTPAGEAELFDVPPLAEQDDWLRGWLTANLAEDAP